MVDEIGRTAPATEGRREQKRRETQRRIEEAALKLFMAHGYDSTTLDAIADEAGISRRTFFSYFNSKEDIVLSGQAGNWNAMLAELAKVSPDEAPLAAVHRTLARHFSRYELDQLVAIDKIMRASDTLIARKQAGYARQEEALFAVLCEVWRQPERQPALRVVAMMSIGAMRIALDGWRNQKGKRPVTKFLDDAFASCRAEGALE